MQQPNKTLATWLIGSIAGAGVLVGGAAATKNESPTRSVQKVESELPECEMGDGQKGRLYGDLCSTTAPFGWVSGSESTPDSAP